MYAYSPKFQQLIDSPPKLRDLLDNCSFSGSFGAWERRKAFIAQAIHKDGTILDIGCGNGFLLRCLQEWSGHELVPYGIDINPIFVQKAGELFPHLADHFSVLDSRGIDELSACGLPNRYDFVFYSNIWKTGPAQLKLVDRLHQLVEPGGRLLLGFYDEQKDVNLEAIEALQAAGLEIAGTIENPRGTNALCWING